MRRSDWPIVICIFTMVRTSQLYTSVWSTRGLYTSGPLPCCITYTHSFPGEIVFPPALVTISKKSLYQNYAHAVSSCTCVLRCSSAWYFYVFYKSCTFCNNYRWNKVTVNALKSRYSASEVPGLLNSENLDDFGLLESEDSDCDA